MVPTRELPRPRFVRLQEKPFKELVARLGGRLCGRIEVDEGKYVVSAHVSWGRHGDVVGYYHQPLAHAARGPLSLPRWSAPGVDSSEPREAARAFERAVVAELWRDVWFALHPKEQ